MRNLELKQYNLDDGKQLLLGPEKRISSKLKKLSESMVDYGMESFLADNIKEKGIYTNGRFLVLDKKLAGEMFEKARGRHKNTEFPKESQLEIDKIIPKNYENCIEAVFSFAFLDKNKRYAQNRMVYNFGNDKVVFNGSFIYIFKKNFPDGKLLVSSKDKPAYYMVGNELKGIIMPFAYKLEEIEYLENKILDYKKVTNKNEY